MYKCHELKNVISDIENIENIEVEDRKTSSASEMAEAFNCHFANVTLVMTWQETYLPLILFQKAILSQLTPLSLLKVVAPMKPKNCLKN